MSQPKMSIFDRLISGTASKDEIAAEIAQTVYAGLEAFCRIPAGYSHCRLETRQIDIERLGEEELSELLEDPPGEIVIGSVSVPLNCRRSSSESLRLCAGRAS